MQLVVEEDLSTALRLVDEVMGEYHGYYASSSRAAGAKGLVALLDGSLAGATVFYRASLDGLSLGVIYYVVVRRRYWRMGIGRVLVASAEELMSPVDAYLATTTSDNRSSARMFESMGYKAYRVDELEETLGTPAYDVIVYATCLYEEDLVMIKEEVPGWQARIAQGHLLTAYRLWDSICYTPWLRRRRLMAQRTSSPR